MYNGDYLFYVDTWPINSHYSTPREEHLFSNSEDRDEFVVLFYLVPSSLYFTLHQRPTRLQMRVYGLCIACVSLVYRHLELKYQREKLYSMSEPLVLTDKRNQSTLG